ncbi:MAG: alpha/beta fold hydrolase [Acidimicrobiales bacterium]|jgi:3-oxoadipate enol-lactonase
MREPLPECLVVGEGPSTLVFLHGLGGDNSNWKPQITEFAKDYRCVAWTLPGYGASPPMEALTWPNLSDMLAQVLDDVGVHRATIIGLSMGGYIAQQFAADHAERVEFLVLAATSSRFGRGSATFAEKFLAARLKPLDDGETPAGLAVRVVPSLLSPDASPETIENCVASMSRISTDAYREALRCLVTWDFTDYLSEIDAPTLCLAGADDATAPVAALQALADGLPDGRLEIIDDCNHLMNLDRPAQFNQLIRNFLNQR